MMDTAALNLMRDIGFPLWALVVAYVTWRVSALFQTTSREMSDRFNVMLTRISENHVDTEKRLILLEKAVERLDKIVERHDDDMRKAR